MINQIVKFVLDADKLTNNISAAKKTSEQVSSAKEFKVRSTVFSVSKDTKVLSTDQTSVPNLFLIEILQDQLKQLFVRINWKVERVGVSNIVGFNVYRRKKKQFFTKKLSFSNFSKFGFNLKKNGKFSFDKKAIESVKKGIIPIEILNSKLANEQEIKKLQSFASLQKSDLSQAEVEKLVFNEFEKIAYIDYSNFINKEKQKKVFVIDSNFANLFFDDDKVSYREIYEYFVTSISKTGEETYQSDTVDVLVIDNKGISDPTLTAKQINEKEIFFSVKFNKFDKIDNVIVMRKSQDEVAFKTIAVFEDINEDKLNFVDKTIEYLKNYSYRVFLKNIDEILSNPAEILLFSSANIIEKSKSNNLRIPIISAFQEQNSNSVSIKIFPNDSLIYFYQLQRRDFSIGEKKFSTPSNWINNQFFVDRKNLTEIKFVDNFVYPQHVYQYRIVGFDIFGNSSSYALAVIGVENKKVLRIPIDMRIEILRQFPIRIKFSWKNDNIEIDNATLSYLVQRRKNNATTYESFPLVKGEFIVDEAASNDVTDFSVNIEKTSNSSEDVIVPEKRQRSFGVPDFLTENGIYFYRVKTIQQNGDESSFSEEIKVSTLADLSEPINFRAKVANVKVKPLTVQLMWETDQTKLRPDYWVIERKQDNINDAFKTIGFSYIAEEFFDRNVEFGNNFVYRIKSVDTLKRESNKIEARISL